MFRIVFFTLVDIQASFTWMKLRPPVKLISVWTVTVVRTVSVYTKSPSLGFTTVDRPAVRTDFFTFVDVGALSVDFFKTVVTFTGKTAVVIGAF